MGEPKSQNRHRRGSGLWAGDELTHPPGLSGQPEGTSSQRGQEGGDMSSQRGQEGGGTSSQRGQEGGGTSSQRGQEGGRGDASVPVPSPTSSSPLRDPHGQIPVGHPGQGTWECSPGWSSAEGQGLLQTIPGQPAVAAALGPRMPPPCGQGASHLQLCAKLPVLPQPSSRSSSCLWPSVQKLIQPGLLLETSRLRTAGLVLLRE